MIYVLMIFTHSGNVVEFERDFVSSSSCETAKRLVMDAKPSAGHTYTKAQCVPMHVAKRKKE